MPSEDKYNRAADSYYDVPDLTSLAWITYLSFLGILPHLDSAVRSAGWQEETRTTPTNEVRENLGVVALRQIGRSASRQLSHPFLR